MPLTIVATAFLGWWWIGLGPAAAVLLGSALAPTDPVLASDVQVGEPGEREDEVRFTLTSASEGSARSTICPTQWPQRPSPIATRYGQRRPSWSYFRWSCTGRALDRSCSWPGMQPGPDGVPHSPRHRSCWEYTENSEFDSPSYLALSRTCSPSRPASPGKSRAGGRPMNMSGRRYADHLVAALASASPTAATQVLESAHDRARHTRMA